MKSLFVSNTGPSCGVSLFGQLHYEALKSQGCDIDFWAADYPSYLPADAGKYDLIHLNHMSGTINHIQRQHIPYGPDISVFFHETNPAWWIDCKPGHELWDEVADYRFCADPSIREFENLAPPRDHLYWFPMPIPDVAPGATSGIKLLRPKIGVTGLRGDGLDRLSPLCGKHGWELSTSGPWCSVQDEVNRLSTCDVVVCHYHNGFSGQSFGVSVAAAARRPLLLNSNQMFSCFRVMTRKHEYLLDDDLERGILTLLGDSTKGRPKEVCQEYSFSAMARKMMKVWEGK